MNLLIRNYQLIVFSNQIPFVYVVQDSLQWILLNNVKIITIQFYQAYLLPILSKLNKLQTIITL